MKIIIKTLSGQNFTIDVEPTDTVFKHVICKILNLKEKIQQVKQLDVTQQKLLRKGTLLDDKTTVAELGMQENEFLVVMVNAKKPQPQQPAQQPAQQPPQQPVQVPPQVPQVQVPPPQPQPVQPATQTGLVSGPEYEKAIEELMSMGFQRAECVNAMKAAFNNPDRAVEYLLNGIPAGLQPAAGSVQPPVPGTQPPVGGAQVPAGGQNQTLQYLRQLYQQNPQAVIAMLPQLLQQVQQTNPALYEQVSQNPELFLQLILSGGAPQQPPQGSIALTQQEFADVETIMAMGFSKQDALEGYLACDKSVEVAINYLFEKQANGDLFSQHLQREQANPQNQQPPGGNPEGEEEDDDDDIYQ